MLSIIFGIFLILHGLVHLLYAGQSWRLFELRPEMAWPDGAWLFSRFLGDESIRLMATVLLVLSAAGFVTGGLGLLFRGEWWRPVIAIAAAVSSLLFIVCWNGKFQALDDQGGIGILINLAILALILLFKWPA
ncbi:MAG: hypothetical protein ACK2T5_08825 [Anaerolineales bacterium]